jgi:hypothetical protein
LDEYQWIVNQGVMFVILVFIGYISLRVLLGHEKTGKKGLLERWSDGMIDRFSTHFKEQTTLGDESKTRDGAEAESLRILVASGEPPKGAAYVAAQAVYRTAVNVEQMQQGMLQSVKICRIIARQYPDMQAEIVTHCDEIERLIHETPIK